MRNSSVAIPFALSLLLTASSSAHAHGLGAIIQPLVVAAALIGAAGGLVSGGTNSHPGYGLLTTSCALMIAELIYLAVESREQITNILGYFGFLFLITAFAGGIPLVIAFFATFAISSAIRERLAERKGNRDVAP